jgi:glycerol kinase
MKYILALDQGTTSSRAILFDQTGAICALAQREFRQIYPQPGWVEHDPNEILETQLAVARQALANVNARDVAAIGITNQRETAVVWERKTGAPIHNAIVWQDRRTAEFCEWLKGDGLEQTIGAKTGLVIDAYFSASKLRWVLDHVPHARERAEAGELAFGTIDSWLIWQLTRGERHVTDVTNASRTMLWNIHRGEWDDELLALFEIPRALLPKVIASSEVSGVAREFEIPIAGIAGDQHAALFGQCCTRPGMAKNTYGTGCFMLLNTGENPVASRNRLLTTPAWKLGSRTDFALEGSVFIAGAAVQWLRDGLGVIRSSSEVEALACSVENTGGVYFVPAFTGLGAPHWNSQARGIVTGLTRGTTAAHIARAALDSIAYQSADVLDAMQRDSGAALRELRADGGAAVNDYLMQFQADILGVPVVRPEITETTALGAAFLVGLAVGVWKNESDLERTWKIARRFEPQMSEAKRAELRAGWNDALARTML